MTRPFKLGFLTHAPRQSDPARLYEDLIELFAAAEDLGFDGGWIAQHHLSGSTGGVPSPLVLLAAIAERTERIELGTGITVLPLEDPLRLAEDAAVLDALSGGRVQLGLGSGGANQSAFAAFGETWADKTESFRRRRQTLQALLAGATLDGTPSLRLEPPAPGLADRLWHSHATADGAAYAARQGNGFLLGTAVHNPETVQKPLAEAYLDAWSGSRAGARIGVIRAVFPAEDKAAAQAELADDLKPFAAWLTREGLAEGAPDTAEIIRLLNVHHGTVGDIIDSLGQDPALFQYADYFIPVVQSESSTLPQAIRRLEVIANQIAPAFGWHREH